MQSETVADKTQRDYTHQPVIAGQLWCNTQYPPPGRVFGKNSTVANLQSLLLAHRCRQALGVL